MRIVFNMKKVFKTKAMLMIIAGVISCAAFNNESLAAKTSSSAKNFASVRAKRVALNKLRIRYSKESYRGHQLNGLKKESVEKLAKLLKKDGTFSDLEDMQKEVDKGDLAKNKYGGAQRKVSNLVEAAMNRLWKISESFRGGKNAGKKELKKKVFKGFIHYGKIELSRANVSNGRFHTSCFAIPNAAINSYFCFFKDMQRVEYKRERNPLFIKFNKIIKKVGFQAWTQPYRNDKTDKNVVDINRFRKHVWWVGGNGICYRPVITAAIMMNNVKMMDVTAYVAKHALSVVSQTTYNKAFWTEGFTADGSGWGHGKQNLVWGYPVHGASAALDYLAILKGTPWSAKLSRSNIYSLINYFRGSSYAYYKGYFPPAFDRSNMVYGGKIGHAPSLRLVKQVLRDWSESLTSSQNKELQVLIKAMEKDNISTITEVPYYRGIRYFYNNDSLIAKNPDYYVLVNMASKRVNGLESTTHPMAKYNFYTASGQTIMMRKGFESKEALGGYNLTAFPGVTARQGEKRLTPVTNWGGYNSKYNFAGGVTRLRTRNGASAFVFETQKPKDVKVNEILYGVRAVKGYFFINDMMVCLGAGVGNLEDKQEGDIWTTIDQTLWLGEVKVGSEAFSVDNKKHEFTIKEREAKNSKIVTQKGQFSYYVIPTQTPGEAKLVCEKRPSKWKQLANVNKNKNCPSSVNIFQLWINHGRKFSNDKYGYIVNLSKKPQDFSKVKVIVNNSKLQAVRSVDNKVIMAAFYDGKKAFKIGSKIIKVSAPCLLMIETDDQKNKTYVSVVDPLMNKRLNKIGVAIGNKKMMITLPTEPDRGKPRSIAIKKIVF